MQIKRIHHVAILTGDYEKSKHFYTKILGFTIIAENYRAEKKNI
jgi:glyoxylase I family protein